MIELLSMLKSGPVGRSKAVPKLLSILVNHPETRSSLLGGTAKPPASFATTRFNGLNTFSSSTPMGSDERFVIDSSELGEIALDPQHVRTLSHDFLIAELDQRLTQGPVGFILAFQFAEPGDTTTDPSIAWPEQRLLVPAGQIIVTSRSSNEDCWQQ
ncbi:hypothetical protein [Rhodococcus koreensis]